MTQDEIIRMAREAGLWPGVTDVFPKELERFAALVSAHEREKQAEQEPVAWRCVIPRRTWTFGVDWGREYFENEYEIRGLQGVEPLYAAPVSIEAAVLAEREACAKVCDEPSYMQQRAKTSAECAAAIRARDEK